MKKNNFLLAFLLFSVITICACEGTKNSQKTSTTSINNSSTTSSTTISSNSKDSSSPIINSSSSSKTNVSTESSSNDSSSSTTDNKQSTTSSSSSSNFSSSSTTTSIGQSSSSSSSPVVEPVINAWLADNIQSSLPKETAVIPESIAITEENGKYTIAFAPANDNPLHPYKIYAYNSNNELVKGYPKVITNGGAISHFPEAGTYTIKIKTTGDYINTQDSNFATSTKTITESSPTGVNEPECDYGNPLITATHLTSPIGLEVKSNIDGIAGHVIAFSEASVENASYFKAYATDSKGNIIAGFPRTIKAGDSIPYFSVNGTYYVYVQAIGDDVNYKNSPLSNGIAVNETNGTGIISPELVNETPSKTAIALSSPVGVVISELVDDTTNLIAAWANDNNATSYLIYIATADGTLLTGYPSAITNGGAFATPNDGTYYVYIQAIGDGNTYSNSPLSSPIKINIVNGKWSEENVNPDIPTVPDTPIIQDGTKIDLSNSTYSGGDLVFLSFTPINGLNNTNIENLIMTVTNQDGTDVLKNSLFNFNPTIGYWAIQLNSAGHSSVTVTFSFTYNGVNYIGTQLISA